jgi:hypothetical protein
VRKSRAQQHSQNLVRISVAFSSASQNLAATYQCRARAKFRACILLIWLKLQNPDQRNLSQRGKLFRRGTLEIQIREKETL